MLSYQHAFHAGNAADVHKHALLAVALDYLVQKDKPLTYLETHSGRAIYDLSGAEAMKTGEAAMGIQRLEAGLGPEHPLAQALAATRSTHGPMAYPGSPSIARYFLRPSDRMVLAELHPQEAAALRRALPRADVRQTDGPGMALSLTPPEPRRGLCLIDPAYEVKTEFKTVPKLVEQLHRKWPVGVLMVWYPILASGAERHMARALDGLGIDKTMHHRVSFPPARPGHGMIGSGLFAVNPPWVLPDSARDLDALFGQSGPR